MYPVTLTFNLWPWKSKGFQILLRSKYVPSLVKIHWRMLILECSQGCYAVTLTFDLWPWKSIGFQILLRTKDVPSLVKIHWRMLILKCPQGCYTVKNVPSDLDLYPMTLKINRVPDSPKYVPSLIKIHWRMLILVFTRMLCGKNLTLWKSIGFQILLRTKYVPSLVKIHWRILFLECSQGLWQTEGRAVALLYPLATSLARG
jgi:hypothetical protein